MDVKDSEVHVAPSGAMLQWGYDDEVIASLASQASSSPRCCHCLLDDLLFQLLLD